MQRILTQQPSRPNIVLIVADYMGYTDVNGGSDDVKALSLAKEHSPRIFTLRVLFVVPRGLRFSAAITPREFAWN